MSNSPIRVFIGLFLSLVATAATLALVHYFWPLLYGQPLAEYKSLDTAGIQTGMYALVFLSLWSFLERLDARWGAASLHGSVGRIFRFVDIARAVGALAFFSLAAIITMRTVGKGPQLFVVGMFWLAAFGDLILNGLHHFKETTAEQRLAYGIDSLLVATNGWGGGFTAIPTIPGYITVWSYRDEAGNHYRQDANGQLALVTPAPTAPTT